MRYRPLVPKTANVNESAARAGLDCVTKNTAPKMAAAEKTCWRTSSTERAVCRQQEATKAARAPRTIRYPSKRGPPLGFGKRRNTPNDAANTDANGRSCQGFPIPVSANNTGIPDGGIKPSFMFKPNDQIRSPVCGGQ